MDQFLQGSGSAVHLRLAEAIRADAEIIVPEVVRMELLIGGTSEEWATRRRMLDAFEAIARHTRLRIVDVP